MLFWLGLFLCLGFKDIQRDFISCFVAPITVSFKKASFSTNYKEKGVFRVVSNLHILIGKDIVNQSLGFNTEGYFIGIPNSVHDICACLAGITQKV